MAKILIGAFSEGQQLINLEASRSSRWKRARVFLSRVELSKPSKKSIEHWDKIQKDYKVKVRRTSTGTEVEDHIRVRDEMEEKVEGHKTEQNECIQKIKLLEPRQKEILNILKTHT